MLTLINTGKSFCVGTDMESIWEGDGVQMGGGAQGVDVDDTVPLGVSCVELRRDVDDYYHYCYDGVLTVEDCPKTMVALV